MQKHWTYDGSANVSYIEPYLSYRRTRKMYVFNLIGYELNGFPRRVDQNKQGYKNIFTTSFFFYY